MNCAEVRERLETEPIETARAAVAPHLAECPSCRAEVELLEAIVRELPSIALEPVRRRRIFAPWLIPAAAMLGFALLWFSAQPPGDLSERYASHVAASRTFFKEARNLRGEDPARDARLAAEEWRVSGLAESTRSLAPLAGSLPAAGARFVRECAEVERDLDRGSLAEVRRVAEVPPAPPAPPLPVSAPPGGLDEISRFVAARRLLYAGDLASAGTLFDRFLRDYPASVYASDAAYWKARCARERGDRRTLLDALERITEEEWVDDAVVADVRALLSRPGVRVMQGPDGRIMIVSPVESDRVALPPVFRQKVFARK